ncbi:hypothetical protein [Kiloniella majae]|uniref:hypothetical protein n=1 Tax=Kiloniella majae TaxID=1938558 RepID=UPI000A279535|nr:hypothetical protein [Kiloniella majae]
MSDVYAEKQKLSGPKNSLRSGLCRKCKLLGEDMGDLLDLKVFPVIRDDHDRVRFFTTLPEAIGGETSLSIDLSCERLEITGHDQLLGELCQEFCDAFDGLVQDQEATVSLAKILGKAAVGDQKSLTKPSHDVVEMRGVFNLDPVPTAQGALE